MICRADALTSRGSGRCCKASSGSRAEPWWGPGGGGLGAKPSGALKILQLTVLKMGRHAMGQIINCGAMTVTLPLFFLIKLRTCKN